MNQDLYGLQASGIDPEIAAQMLGLNSKKAITAALLKQSIQGIDQPQTPARGYTRRIHPLEAVADVLATYMGKKAMEGYDQQEGDLAKQNQAKVQDALAKYEQTRSGTPAIAPATPNDDEGNINPTVPGKAGDPRSAIAQALASPLLQNNPLVKMDMARSAPINLGPDHSLVDPVTKETIVSGTKTMPVREQPKTQLQQLQEYASTLPMGSNERNQVQDAIRKLTVIPKEIGTTINNPPAPTMTEVLDPKDPTRMLRVDAKQYKGGSLGDAGVLGVSGKEPTAAKKEEQVGQGRETVTNIIGELRGHYAKLSEGGGITDPSQGVLSNAKAALSSSGVGQFMGNVAGTDNQSARNSIAQTRPLLLNAIKQATGMSAKQMDSNAELKMYLAAATDPKLDIKANLSALENLDKLYGLSGKKRRASDAPGKVIDFNSLPK